MLGTRAPFGYPADIDPKRFHLISEYTTDSRKWLTSEWSDVYSLEKFHITTTVAPSGNVVKVKSICDVCEEYKAHADAKSAAPDGGLCGANTRGLLRRRTVPAAYLNLIGKESNKIDEVEFDEVHDPDEVLERYSDPKNDPFPKLVIPILRLRDMKRDNLAERTRPDPRSIQARNGKQKPSRKVRATLTRIAGDYAREQLQENIRDDLCACADFIASQHCRQTASFVDAW